MELSPAPWRITLAGSLSCRTFNEPDLAPDLLEQKILVTLHGAPIDPPILKFRVRANLHVGAIVAQLKERTLRPLEQGRVVFGARDVQPIQISDHRQESSRVFP